MTGCRPFRACSRAVLVDDRAIGTDQGQKFVYVVGADNKVAYRAVKIGRLTDGLRIVSQGLQPGETVVVNGLQRVHPGVTVAAERVAMDARENAEALLAHQDAKQDQALSHDSQDDSRRQAQL